MTRKKKSKRAQRKNKANLKLASLFRMSREQLAQRKTTGGGLHKTYHDIPRNEQRRKALKDQQI